MLSRKERKTRHLAVAEYLEQSWTGDEDEIVEVVASHYVDAYEAAPDAPDASDIKEKACSNLARAGRRAESLAAFGEAQRYYEQAAALVDGTVVAQAQFLEMAGYAAQRADSPERAEEYFLRAIGLFEAEGLAHAAARVLAKLALVDWQTGRITQGAERMRTSFDVLHHDEADADFAVLAHQLARLEFFMGDLSGAAYHCAAALDAGERLWLPDVLAQAFNTKGLILIRTGHREEGLGLLKYSLEIALEHDVMDAAQRAYYNLGSILTNRDRIDEGLRYFRDGLALVRKVGRTSEGSPAAMAGNMLYGLFRQGRWDEAVTLMEELPDYDEPGADRTSAAPAVSFLPLILCHRGDVARARRLVEPIWRFYDPNDIQESGSVGLSKMIVAIAEGEPQSFRASVDQLEPTFETLGWDWEITIEGFVAAVEGGLRLNEPEPVGTWLERFDSASGAELSDYVRAHRERFAGMIAVHEGDVTAAERSFKKAAGAFRELGTPFPLGQVLLEHGELVESGGQLDEARPLLEEAHQIFSQLNAAPWIERTQRTAWGAATLAMTSS
jgi:tetratricopeptide (TPR) repeat protein